ncbi:hypothetical protein JAAARDRAFT_187284 [Jaapia argillacea MUCL 33604]|uniref:DUF6532 domain-containing protein n=1 Tax=Jaapia argillacea MUCL 33604 TaxID=933084 RepID=A0A067QA00_9AGAM|nr:hypothetical protein JAAARDRAFT_187284 [Jaapia argillacea MUCL 33604]
MASRRSSTRLANTTQPVASGEPTVNIPPDNKSKTPRLTIKGPSINLAAPGIQPGEETITPTKATKGKGKGGTSASTVLPETNTEIVIPGAEQKKRGRGASTIARKPPTKKSNANQDPVDVGQAPAQLTSITTPQLRDPLPPRAKRVVDPGAPDKPAAQRTSEEVTADAKRKALFEAELEELEAKKIATMARMRVEQMLADGEEEQNTIRHITDLQDPEDDDGEVAVADGQDEIEARVDDEDKMDVNDEAIAEVPANADIEASQTTRKVKKKKAQNKGELRAAVDAAGKDVLGAIKKPTTETGAKPLYSSGLTAAYKKKAAQKSKDSSVSLGGLAEEDAEGAPPPKGSKLQGPQRTNELVAIDSHSDSETETKTLPKPVTKTTRTKTQPKATATPKRNTPKSATVKVTNIQPEVVLQQLQLSVATQDESKLPDFTLPTWVSVFLPTLYACFGSSRKPWTLFTMTIESVPIVVKVFAKCFPGVKFNITLNGKVFKTAIDRINEKRSFIGRRALEIVAEYFSNSPYAHDASEIAKYAQWASRPNGPGIFKDPTPIDCKVSPQDPKYVRPQGIFESDFVIALLSTFLKSTKGSKEDFGYPKGAIAMAAAAIERAFQAYVSGAQCEPKKFSRANYTDVVNQYLKHAHSLSESRWKRILEACGSVQAPQDAAPEVVMDTSSLYLRDSLYIPSSPIQGSDDESE